MIGKKSLRIQAELNGLSRECVYWRRRKGMTLEDALKYPSLQQPVQDHEGTWFPSVRAMTRHWGISHDTFYSRHWSSGWSLERALTTPVHEVQDHMGAKFHSVAEMAAHWGIKYATFRQRIRLHWSLEKALTTPVSFGAQDHEGTRFPTVHAMTERWGIGRTAFRMRLKRGWSLEKALTTPARGKEEG